MAEIEFFECLSESKYAEDKVKEKESGTWREAKVAARYSFFLSLIAL